MFQKTALAFAALAGLLNGLCALYFRNEAANFHPLMWWVLVITGSLGTVACIASFLNVVFGKPQKEAATLLLFALLLGTNTASAQTREVILECEYENAIFELVVVEGGELKTVPIGKCSTSQATKVPWPKEYVSDKSYGLRIWVPETVRAENELWFFAQKSYSSFEFWPRLAPKADRDYPLEPHLRVKVRNTNETLDPTSKQELKEKLKPQRRPRP